MNLSESELRAAWKSQTRKARKKTYKARPWPHKNSPLVRDAPPEAWTQAAYAVAEREGVRPHLVLSDCKLRKVSIARWKAWRIIHEEYPRMSVLGISRITGFDRTSISRSFERLKELGL